MTNKQAKNIIESCDGIMWNRLTDAENEALSMAIEALSTQPERKKGKWIIDKDCEGKSRTVTCNLCGHKEFNWHDPNYCPNCGADMRGE